MGLRKLATQNFQRISRRNAKRFGLKFNPALPILMTHPYPTLGKLWPILGEFLSRGKLRVVNGVKVMSERRNISVNTIYVNKWASYFTIIDWNCLRKQIMNY